MYTCIDNGLMNIVLIGDLKGTHQIERASTASFRMAFFGSSRTRSSSLRTIARWGWIALYGTTVGIRPRYFSAAMRTRYLWIVLVFDKYDEKGKHNDGPEMV
jgi:hypothetical protein